jgi:hypothetical protein
LPISDQNAENGHLINKFLGPDCADRLVSEPVGEFAPGAGMDSRALLFPGLQKSRQHRDFCQGSFARSRGSERPETDSGAKIVTEKATSSRKWSLI